MREYFNEKHVRHLAYFLNKDGEKEREIGCDYRNSLAHLKIDYEMVSIGLVCELMWLLIDLINTIFIKLQFNEE